MIVNNLVEFRAAVLARDKYICQKCGTGEYLIAHHIKAAKLYPKLVLEVDNGQTLCRKCHSKEPWQITFRFKVNDNIKLSPTAPLLSINQVADKFKVSHWTIRKWINQGFLPANKIGPKLWRIRNTDIIAIMRGMR